jgi:DNA-binding NarL/FixJ family response regulator
MPFRRFFESILQYRFLFVRKPVLDGVKRLAKEQRRPEEEVAADLLNMAVNQQHSVEFEMRCFRELTPREQDVTALTCLGYRNAEIATRLGISITTVSTHVRHVSGKYGMHGKAELRRFFDSLDFSAWEHVEDHPE